MVRWFIEVTASSEIHSAYLQVLSLGFVWVFVHCAPMCGPIVGGLRLEQYVRGNIWAALFWYQLGRALVYALLGGLAGFLGAEVFRHYPEAGWLVVGVLLLLTLQKFLKSSSFLRVPMGFFRLWGRVASRMPNSFKPFFLGILLGFLPCMLTFWALTLAAGTGNPWQGAVTMLLLVIITSFPIAFSLMTANLLSQLKRFSVEKYLLLISCVWATLMTLASNDWIEHFHIRFQFFGKHFMLMLW